MKKIDIVSLRAKRSNLLRDCFVALLLAMTLFTPAHADVKDGLIGHWTFDEGTGTASADTCKVDNPSCIPHNGTLINGAVWKKGIVGSGALEFDGKKASLSTTFNPARDLTNDFTVAFWANPTVMTGSYLFAHWNTGQDKFYLRLVNSENEGQLSVGIGNWESLHAKAMSSSWQHYAVVLKGTTGSFYRKGLLLGSEKENIAVKFASKDMAIGSWANVAGFFSGQMDDFRIYNRALSPDEILELANKVDVDIESPSTPSGLTATGVAADQIYLKWNASTDNIGVAGYKVVRDGVEIANVKTTDYEDKTGIRLGVIYKYELQAYDSFGNRSTPSIIVAGKSEPAVCFNHVCTAPSGNVEDVEIAVRQAKDGDTVIIPPGVWTWGSQVSINKAITIQGAGVKADGLAPEALAMIGGGTPTETVIIDAIPDGQSPSIFFIQHTSLTHLMRITGIRFKGLAEDTSTNGFGIIRIITTPVLSNAPPFRFDHLMFDRVKARPITFYAYTGGVVDHCIFDQTGSGHPGMAFDGRVPDAENKGHLSWATPVEAGGANAGIYLETNYMANLDAVNTPAIIDGFAGARYVLRHNTLINLTAQNHGTDSAGIYRSTRWMEIYNNTFKATVQSECAVFFRGGSGVVFNNDVSGKYPGLARMVNYRLRDRTASPYGQGTGINPWDLNDPKIFATGKHTGADGSTVLEDNTASWKVNEWKGYHVYNPSTGRSGEVLSNTAKTITLWTPTLPDISTVYWQNGDMYEMRKIIRAFDGVGQGTGDLLIGGSNGTGIAPTPFGWPHQADDPIYYWNNKGITNVSNGGYYTIAEGVQYIVDKIEKPGYAPYVYPHPLVSGEIPVLTGSGDVSGDGKVTMYDAALVLRFTLGSNLTDAQKTAADKNGDGKVDGADVVAIARKALGL